MKLARKPVTKGIITIEPKQQINDALSFYEHEIIKEGYEHDVFLDSDTTDKWLQDTAKERLIEDLEGFELLDIDLNDFAFREQENELINYINNL